MVKSFKEVKDLERAKAGDIVVFPEGERRLNLSVSTFAKMGLSVGDMSRSENARSTVESWLVRRDVEPRAFLVADASYGSVPDGDALLLGLGAVRSLEREDPKIVSGTLVPFGPGLWTMPTWAGCWDKVTGGAVRERILDLMGDAGALNDSLPASGDQAEDLWMNQAWDGLPCCVGWQSSKPSVYWYFPHRRGRPTADTYLLNSLMRWDGQSRSTNRIRFSSGFLKELGKRGAVAFRPDRRFAEAVTASVARWACESLARRFAERTAAGKAYLKGLAGDVKRDKGRVKAYMAASRKLAREATGMPKAVAKLKAGRPGKEARP